MDYVLTLAITPDGAGGVIIKPSGKYVGPGQASFPAGTALTLTSMAQVAGARFDHWEGAATGAASPTTLTMDSSKSVGAVFAMPSQTGTVELRTAAAGSGSIAPGSGIFNPGEQIILVATPGAGNSFVAWSGDTDGCTPVPGRPNVLVVVMDRARRIVATFQADATPAPTDSPVASRPLAIPHPEEAMNPAATLANTDVTMIMTKWLQDWGVPLQHWEYWKTAIDMQVYDVYPDSLGMRQDIPAGTWEAGGKRHLAIKPRWLNPGVIAHEQAHNSYALLSADQKTGFASVYAAFKNADPLIRLLYSRNTYGLTNDIEGHAEVYRYIGQHMPAQLKPYYPMLF
jgi:hypothetical protein